ncbi:hypothetical protein CYMTET_55520 [Cymbomonas tetramitiformis]|uniref:Uncharacterized protein n=1 Tax=Cymbomonas tetramitiformis TaxID=36881 RepID=A0AAE0BEM2_9CHLO|nr:hypothetical protein CYMTET_55520 [Cymbomonas tetramitiformis]
MSYAAQGADSSRTSHSISASFTTISTSTSSAPIPIPSINSSSAFTTNSESTFTISDIQIATDPSTLGVSTTSGLAVECHWQLAPGTGNSSNDCYHANYFYNDNNPNNGPNRGVLKTATKGPGAWGMPTASIKRASDHGVSA